MAGGLHIVVTLRKAPYAVVVRDAGDIYNAIPMNYGSIEYAPTPLGITMLRPSGLEEGIRSGFLGVDSYGTDAGIFFVDELPPSAP